MDKYGLTIEEAASYTVIGRDTIRKLAEWEKFPVLRIGRKSIVLTKTIERFMQENQGVDLLDREQVRAVK